ncbi:6308_t:CDS:2 [Cetraspora pellucida]|uniref:6308_t:CDS:1 n=1 Tax=Cetraspora pellucida TaxID=1433469 RepID=A0A9N9IU24_9GLOM|nr:6308_t:CDS:2 [Cetraspora pellucida]
MRVQFSTRDVLIRNVGDYDVKIIVGEEGSSKEFLGHTVILRTRCEYFKIALSSTWATSEDGVKVFVKPNIHPLVFEAIIGVGLDPDVSRWSSTDFSLLEERMRNCLPRIRMNNIDMEEYYHNVRPFKKIFSLEIQERIEEYYFTGRKLDISFHPRLPFIIDSCLINYKHAALFAHWINRKEGKLVTREKNPFNFRLLIRGSDHGFCGEVFDRIRFEYPALLVLILTESEEMIGGYQRINSNYWKMFGYDYDRDSFLFRINRADLKRSMISRVIQPNYAVYNHNGWGPCFGDGDLWLRRHFREAGECNCKKSSYEFQVTLEESFLVKEYEIFEVTTL